MASIEFNPHRFQSTVPYYARYRLGYPAALIERIMAAAGLSRGDSAMDLGCGPGLVAIPLARAGLEVVAVDPEPEMLEAARIAAREAGVALDLRQGSSFAMPAGIGPFRLVTMGRSFHWMDRAATLAILDRLIAPGGAIALLGERHPRTAENRWRHIVRDLGNVYGRENSAHVQATLRPDYRTHEPFLLESPFNKLETVGVYVTRTLGVDDIVGLALSLSTSAPQQLGDRLQAFEQDLRTKLLALSPEGRFTEIAEMTALIARRGA